MENKTIWRDQIKTISTFDGAYNDMLQSVVSQRTGLSLTL